MKQSVRYQRARVRVPMRFFVLFSGVFLAVFGGFSTVHAASASLPVSVRVVNCATPDLARAMCSSENLCCSLIPMLEARDAVAGQAMVSPPSGDTAVSYASGTVSFEPGDGSSVVYE
ncbi:hypothetical protein [Micavibrio aeruginosavorus]|uniref:hypothetical protein n=1 Tax=Micavibrio aeruginosavorus TaxID=349221 RepID=UPI003F4AC465